MSIRQPNKWDVRFMRIAVEVAGWSKDPSTKVGAVAVLDRRIISTGYNGLPRGIEDSEARLNDRPTKYRMTVHGERNVINNASLVGVSLKGSHIYIYGVPPCNRCSIDLIQVGVSRICLDEINLEENLKRMNEGDRNAWSSEWAYSQEMFKEVGIEVNVFKFEDIQNLG